MIQRKIFYVLHLQANNYPALNLHVAEPLETSEPVRQERVLRRGLLELEAREARQREFLASSIAATAQSLSQLADIVEKTQR